MRTSALSTSDEVQKPATETETVKRPHEKGVVWPPEIGWGANVPQEVRAALEPFLDHWRALLPTWCQELRVKFDADRDSRMAVTVNYRNRWAVLLVTGHWLEDDPAERANALRHEIVHVLLEPFSSAVVRIIEDTLEEGTAARELAASMFTDGMEAAVEDLARAIGRVSPPSPSSDRPQFSQVEANLSPAFQGSVLDLARDMLDRPGATVEITNGWDERLADEGTHTEVFLNGARDLHISVPPSREAPP